MKKYIDNFIKFFLYVIVLILVISIVFTVNVCSAIQYAYTEQNIDFISNVNLRCSTDLESNTGAIVNMSVSPKGFVAIALDNESVLVYDNKGNFLKQFKFDSYGAYYIRWYHDILELILVREDTLVEFTLDCKIVGLHYIDSSKIVKELKDKAKITVNNETYEIKNKRFTGYATLTKTNESGEERVLYSSEVSSTAKSVILIVIFVFGFTIIPYVVLSKQIKYVKEKRRDTL